MDIEKCYEILSTRKNDARVCNCASNSISIDGKPSLELNEKNPHVLSDIIISNLSNIDLMALFASLQGERVQVVLSL